MNKYKHLTNSMSIEYKENGLHVRKEAARLNIKEVDPRCVELRGTRCLHHLNLPEGVSREHGNLSREHGKLCREHGKVSRAEGMVSGAHQIVLPMST